MINRHYFSERTARSTRRAINAHRPVSRRHVNEGVEVTTVTSSNTDDNCFAGCVSQYDIDITTGLIDNAAADLTYYYSALKDNTFLCIQQTLYSLCALTKSLLMPYCNCECKAEQTEQTDDSYDFDIVVDERTIVPANKKMNRK